MFGLKSLLLPDETPINKAVFADFVVLGLKHGIKCMQKLIAVGISRLLFGLLLSVCVWYSMVSQAKTLTVAAAQWPGYTHADGSGLYFQDPARSLGNRRYPVEYPHQQLEKSQAYVPCEQSRYPDLRLSLG